MYFTAFILCGILMIVIYKLMRKQRLSIPGPGGLPGFGNIFQIDKDKPYLSIHHMAQKYGGIFTLRLFLTNIVVVNDYKNIHHVLVEKSSNFDGRPKTFRFDYLHQSSDIALVDSGPEVKGRRKVVHSYIKQYGKGIEKIEMVTNEATGRLISKLHQSGCQPIDFTSAIYQSVTEVVSVLLTGKILDEHDIHTIMDAVNSYTDVLKNDAAGQLLDALPIIRLLPNKIIKQMDFINHLKERYVSKWIKSKPDDGFISHVQNMAFEQQKLSFISEKKEKLNVSFQFFVAGTITTSTSLACLANILSQNPSIQRSLQREVTSKIGKSRPPKISDRADMPYHKAVILEIGRFATIVPLAVAHRVTTDTKIDEYFIPKDTEVWVSLWTLHHDDSFWDKPFEFCPERYLDDNGELLPSDHPNRKHTMPFGAGNRGCIGEIFAQARMFLYIASLMQHFTILPETILENQPSYDSREMTFGSVNKPPPFKVRFQPL